MSGRGGARAALWPRPPRARVLVWRSGWLYSQLAALPRPVARLGVSPTRSRCGTTSLAHGAPGTTEGVSHGAQLRRRGVLRFSEPPPAIKDPWVPHLARKTALNRQKGTKNCPTGRDGR